MRPRLRDVAELAGVHPATASRALNEHTRSRLSPETVARVLAAAAELSYSPNQMAQGLATNKSSTIGVIVGDLSVPLFPPVLLGIDDVMSQAGYTALIVNTDNDRERELARLATLRSRQVDGLIVATALTGPEAENDKYPAVAPTVFVVRTPNEAGAASVLSDDSAGMHAVIEHLYALGHRRIAHVAGPANISTSVARLRAYREALFERDLPMDPALIATVDHLSADAGAAGLASLLDSGTQFTAVVAFNDLLAYGCYRTMRDRGLYCPQDISVVGYSDQNGSDLVSPALTTVKVDHYTMGAEAARMLLGILRAPDDPRRHSIRVPVSLTVRDSTTTARSGTWPAATSSLDAPPSSGFRQRPA
ncbi:LacI family DNA-binding transcriptional regulator [Kineococcus sp. SYSU DK003]|uniref:LacI family DNA-binding transcriptional regulator n=1 Tax=Kineococcus sp. SYSU DK003 TaxID=3383124 RepID=UPI003D7CED81